MVCVQTFAAFPLHGGSPISGVFSSLGRYVGVFVIFVAAYVGYEAVSKPASETCINERQLACDSRGTNRCRMLQGDNLFPSQTLQYKLATRAHDSASTCSRNYLPRFVRQTVVAFGWTNLATEATTQGTRTRGFGQSPHWRAFLST